MVAAKLALLALLLAPPQGTICLDFQGRIVAPNPTEGAEFGQAISVAGDLALVGAPRWGNPDTGAAFVFRHDGSSWNIEAFLSPSGLTFMGRSVMVDGDTLLIGEPNLLNGTVTIWNQLGGLWTRTGELRPDPVSGQQGFGLAMELDVDTLAVSARYEANGQGAVYVFRRAGSGWTREARLEASDGAALHQFGYDISIDGDTLVAGAPIATHDTSGATPRAYVFERTGSTWAESAILFGSDAISGDRFGVAVGLDGDTLAVGAPRAGSTEGAAYVFSHSGGAWTETQKLTHPQALPQGFLGGSLLFTQHRLLIGAPGSTSSSVGRVYSFHEIGGAWVPTGVLSAPAPTQTMSRFGMSMVADEGRLFVGEDRFHAMHGEDGAVAEFQLPLGPETYCTGKLNSAGCVPFLVVEGQATAAAFFPLRIEAHDVLDGNFGFLLYGTKKANLDFHGGKLCIKAPVERLLPPKFAKAEGMPPCRGVHRRNFNALIQSGADPRLSVGATVFAQWLQRDSADPAGFGDSLSDAVRFEICP